MLKILCKLNNVIGTHHMDACVCCSRTLTRAEYPSVLIYRLSETPLLPCTYGEEGISAGVYATYDSHISPSPDVRGAACCS